ncbi:heavy metal translocating P-type ATPase [Oceanicella actignis]|uniref:Cu2+-exporting ATPase n=1 Tax=Oceanicella actignis TaxID=1189325 RepID=A0A1M7TJP9_9RHOB|nr:heavy metal translocating P-type ATPase [Oceanicella actignis]SET66888.1 Cu2+-exporting ATPase [Oceanicella actignis]SHN70940.1 Cu2+-exporting ATPase [Oceanicella actignis]
MSMAADAPPPAAGACCPTGAAVTAAGTAGLERWARQVAPGRMRIELMTPEAHCAACIATIERGLNASPGVLSARLNLSSRRVTVEYDPARTGPQGLVEALAGLGYQARPFDADALRAIDRDEEGRELLARLAVAGFAAMNVMLLSVSVWSGAADATRDLLHWISGLIALPAAAFAGAPFYRSAWSALRAGRINMDVPISLAVILAAGISLYETARSGEHAYFDAAVSLLFFLLLGRYLDHRTRRAARMAAAELAGLQARSAVLIENGERRVIPVDDLRPDDVVEIPPGERAPADGEVLDGLSDVDRSMLTGESAPEPLGPGAEIHAGMINLSAPLRMRVTAVGDQTLLAGIARMIEAAERARTRFTRWADAAARIYAPLVHLAALAALIGWLAAGAELRQAVMIAAAVLIITCPCALGLAVPAVHAAAGGTLFRSGVFLKDGAALETLSRVDMAVFDKTGTLTLGAPRLVDGPEDPHQWAAALALAQSSRHPFARALAEAARARAVAPAAVEELREVPGCGVEGRVGGRIARLGRADWCGGAEPEGAETSSVWLRLGDEAPVRFALEDPLREDAAEVVAELRRMGLEVRLLSGDAPGPVRRAARGAGIDAFEAGMTPADKLARLEAWRAEGRRVLMVGDGINDAPALAAAAASMSPAEAADVSRAAAGLVFAGARLAPVTRALRVARAARRRAIENFALAAVYNMIAAPAAMMGLVTPLVAALAMSSSSIVVTLNALRLRNAR